MKWFRLSCPSGIVFLLFGLLAQGVTGQDLLTSGRVRFPADAYLIFLGEGKVREDAVANARVQAWRRIAEVLGRADVDTVREESWNAWIRTAPEWSVQGSTGWQVLAIVSLKDLDAQLLRDYEEVAIGFRSASAAAVSAADALGYLRHATIATRAWPRLARLAEAAAALVPFQEEMDQSLTEVVRKDRPHPWGQWRQDRELRLRLEELRNRRLRVLVGIGKGISKSILQQVTTQLKHDGLAVVEGSGPADSIVGLRLVIDDTVRCEKSALGHRCEARVSWKLDAYQGSRWNGYAGGKLDRVKALHPVGEPQAMERLEGLVLKNIPMVLLASVRHALPAPWSESGTAAERGLPEGIDGKATP